MAIRGRLLEHLRTRQQKEAWTVRIFATDIDNAALEYARQGRYPREAAGELTARRLAELLG